MIGIDAILKIGEKVLDRVLPDPAAKAEAQAKLMELAQKGDLANLQAEVDFARIDAEDRDSARSRESEMAKADVWDLTKNINTVLAMGVIALSFILFAALMTIEVKSMAKDILIYILGVLSAAVTQILSFYFGSSQGSKNKQAEIDKLMGGNK
jgi:K+-sensing histidine kinase KdpD